MQQLKLLIISNTNFYLRIVLFLAFVGHGMVSLGLSPSYTLHYGIADAINFTTIDTKLLLRCCGVLDIMLALLIISKTYPTIVLKIALGYLVIIGVAAVCFFNVKSESIFGIAEFMRRMPWMFFTIYLLIEAIRNQSKEHLIRLGISFAFLAHGLASLGFFGLKGGHIELATQIVTKEQAQVFVYYSGIADSIIGVLLFTGVFSKYVAPIGTLWIMVIVVLSYMNSFADGIFRTGFLLASLYVALQPKCHEYPFIKLNIKK